MDQTAKRDILLLLLISLTLNTYLFAQTHVISMDGAFQFLPMAKKFLSASLEDAIRYTGQQPLYPLLIALVSPVLPDIELAGRFIASFFGILLVIPTYLLTKRVTSPNIAFLSVLFLVIHPYVRRYSADVLKESTYLCLLALAVWFTVRSLQRGQLRSFIFVPCFSVLCYLTRPDGIEVILALLIYIPVARSFKTAGRKIRILLLVCLSSMLFFLPYLLQVRAVTGEWALSKTKGLLDLLILGIMQDGIPLSDKILYTLKKLNLEILTIYHPVYLFLGLIGLGKKILTGLRPGEGFLCTLGILHYGVLFLLILNLTDWSAPPRSWALFFSGRHVLPFLILSIHWVGEGSRAFYQGARFVGSRILTKGEVLERKTKLLWVCLLVLMFVIVLPKTLKPQRYRRLPEKWVGTWIKNRSGAGTTVCTTLPRIAYYAEGVLKRIDANKDLVDQIQTSCVQKKTVYLAIRVREASHLPTEIVQKNFIEVLRYDRKEMEKLVVYERRW